MKCTICDRKLDIRKEPIIHQLDTKGNQHHFHSACYEKWDDPAKDDFEVIYPYRGSVSSVRNKK